MKERERRPFRSLEDARNRVRGIGAATLEQIARYFDRSDEPRLSALPSGAPKAIRTTAKRGAPRRKKPGTGTTLLTKQADAAARSGQRSDL
jgi:hypothetical protein